MASSDNLVVRTMARIGQLFGITNTSDLASGPSQNGTGQSIHYGMFSDRELRHLDNTITNPNGGGQITEMDIVQQLKDVSSNSKKMIDEMKSLTMMAPELEMAESVIISSIMSPTDLQTDTVSVAVDSDEISTESKTAINTLLNDYFNNEFGLGKKLYEWLSTAGFHDGAKAIMIIPQTELNVLNEVADSWDEKYKNDLRDLRSKIDSSTEGLQIKNSDKEKFAIEMLSEVTCESLTDLNVGAEYMSEEDKKKFEAENTIKDAYGKVIKCSAPTAKNIAKDLIAGSFKILKPTGDGNGVIVTRDLSLINKGYAASAKKASEYMKEAEKQINGFDPKNTGNRPNFTTLSISEILSSKKEDMPILVEFPADSVIPVCAPGDKKNHLGYFVLINEYGQPIRGEYAFDGTSNSDVTHRLATNAARAIFGNQNVNSFQISGMTDGQIVDNLSHTFSVAVNYLLKSKLDKDGLRGLDISVHDAVGKALFFNLLAKNQVKMVFVPEPMMIYYRFDHREDGTGKTFLESIKFLLAIRCTLMIAELMAAIDNATKHRVIEVQVDDKNVNPLETMELARQMFISKKAPNITNDPRSAVESIINSHLSIRPKGMQGVVDDLSISHETQYGQSQAPASDLLDKINNMIGIGLKVPPSVLNNLNETEYSRSVATSNLFFANNVRIWQATIRPYNKKFLVNYIMCCGPLMHEIEEIIENDIHGADTVHVKDNTSDCIKDNQVKDPSELMKKVLSTIELVLSPPNMSTSKAHFEELGAEADAIQKLLELIYPDDVAPSDELKNYMSAVRAMVASKLVREFLPKLGVHEIAEVPSIVDIDTDETAKILQFLGNLKNRAQHIEKLVTGQLADGVGNEDTTMPSETSTDNSKDQGSTGGDDDMSAMPEF